MGPADTTGTGADGAGPYYPFLAVGLLERGEQLATLADAFGGAADAGRFVLITGEAGAGKSALVQEFCTTLVGGAAVRVGRCDDLFAARPLGPVADMARGRRGPLAAAFDAGDQAGVFDAFLSELSQPQPVVVVLEDLQWADDATLDLLRFVVRRLDALSCLILATHRDDLMADHPLRRASGSLVGPLVTRLHVPNLSVDAVRDLAAGTGLDPVALHARTDGNPFFVTELLGARSSALPETVRDAVAARAASVSGAARDALDAAAVLGREAGADDIRSVGDCDYDAIDECVHAGLLMAGDAAITFRHDLAREAVDASMTPLRRRQLHLRALAALGDDADMVRRAHHAVAAASSADVLELAPLAAAECVALGAFREAATLYCSALAHAPSDDTERRRPLLEGQARVCERLERFDDAMAAGEELLTIAAAAGDERELGTWEAWLGGVFRCAGRGTEAWELLHQAIARLEPFGSSQELARALALLAQQQMVSSRSADAVLTGRRAQAMAESVGLEEMAVHALNSYGTALCCLDDDTGLDVLAEALDRAKRASIHHEVTRASTNLAEALMLRYSPMQALPVLEHAIGVANEHELHFGRSALLALRARCLLLLGRWDDATADVRTVLAYDDLSAVNRALALSTLGVLGARSGDPNAHAALDEALSLSVGFDEPQMIYPVLIAKAEATWLAGAVGRASEIAADTASRFRERPEPWYAAELIRWCRRLDVPFEATAVTPEPIALLLDGDCVAAARAWFARGCVYEYADALGDSDDPDDLRTALVMLTELGARPRARLVTRRLRSLGVRDVPRGPRASTRANPAGLTGREVEVASLVAAGLTNAEIAARLVLSAKTVDHHVSSVIAKLGVDSRRQVAAAGAALGLALQYGEQLGTTRK